MRGKRGRPPAPQPPEESAPAAARGLRPRRNIKPRARDSGDEEPDSPVRETSKPGRKKKAGCITSTRGRGRGRGGRGRGGRGGRGGRRPAPYKAVVYDDHESEEEDDAVSLRSEEFAEEPQSEEEEALKEDSDGLEDEDVLAAEEEEEEVEDDASSCTESSFRSHASTPGRKRGRAPRPRTPILEEKNIPSLELPASSEDLLVPNEELLNAISVYEVLRHFSTVLRLSPFRFEDFCSALAGQEQCTLIAETHISLLKAILREEDTSNTTFGPADLKDSVNSTLYFIDGMTWPEVLRAYCESDKEYHHVLRHLLVDEYPYGTLETKIRVLQFLVDQFLTTNIAREELMADGAMQYDDHCRVCHRLGDLLCCETCSAVYHLECVKPPLTEVPEDEWQCEICVAHKVPGVTDCVTEVQKNKPYIRQEPVGYDRHQRKYWFLNRRIIVEEDGEHEKKKIWYYSSRCQLEELMLCLDKEYWEMDLCATLEEMKEEVHAHMDITEELTSKARGNTKAYLTAANEETMERLKGRRTPEEEKKQEETGSTSEAVAESNSTSEEPAEPAEPRAGGHGETPPETASAEPTAPPTGQEGDPAAVLAGLESSESHTESLMESQEGGDAPPEQDKEADDQKSDGDDRGSETAPAETRLNPESGAVRAEPPDLHDPSSHSSFTSQDGTEEYNIKMNKTGLDSNQQPNTGSKESSPSRSDCEASFLSLFRRETPPAPGLFKLGQEGKYRIYQNQYSTNVLALNKHQHREDHDKRRHLSHKFSLTTASEFKWSGAIYGSRGVTVNTLRLTIIQLETNVPPPFMHPNWASHRTNWNKAVQMCSKAREFALALAILECAIKPVVTLPVWKESLGHTRLHRMTSMEREEKEKVKKREKKLEDEETLQQATWVKYTIPIKHQVWKQKGEEYRVTGYGGWSWVSKTHVPRFVPRLPGNTNANYRRDLEASKLRQEASKVQEEKDPKVEQEEVVTRVNGEDEEMKCPAENGHEHKHETPEEEEKMETAGASDSSPGPASDVALQSTKQETDQQNPPEEPASSRIFYDVVNVSEGFQLRTAYKKKVKPCKLDGLLERRVKQFALEEKQRLERVRQAGLQSRAARVKTEAASERPPSPGMVKKEESDPVVKKLDFGPEQMENLSEDHKELNGGSLLGSGLISNCAPEPRASTVESTKKRSYEEMNTEEDPEKTALQVNGDTSDAMSGPADPVQDPPKSLVNGNVAQNELSHRDHPPPLKLPKLENHVVESNVNHDGSKALPPHSDQIHAEKTETVTTVTTSNPSTQTSGSTVTQKPRTSSSTAATISKDYSTKDRVSLLKFSRSKKARSGTALPSYRKFVTKSSKRSIFILPNDDLKRLARRAGIREVPIFNYGAKPAPDIWPYPSPRPTFGITWRYRLQTMRSLAGVSLMLRLLWACLRWDDMAVKAPVGVGTTRKKTTDTDIITTEIIRRRDVEPHGIRSEYCIRKIICPLGNRDAPKETPTPQRKGLRSSALRPKKQEPVKQVGPVAVETWVPEEDLELWEIRAFAERLEKDKAQGIDSSKSCTLKTAEEVKAHLENQLKQARLAAQQKRLEMPRPIAASPLSTPTSTISTLPSTPLPAPRPGTVTPGTKMVLASKLSSSVPLQQDKNFHQSFASWVKQGQSSTSSSAGEQKVQSIFPSGPPANLRTYSTLHPTTGNLNLRASSSSPHTQVPPSTR